MKKVSVALCGTGGYGAGYAEELMKRQSGGSVRLVGAVDPFPEKSPCYALLRDAGVRVVPSFDEAETFEKPDLFIISSPIQFHAPQSVMAFGLGARILCEKPLAATVQDAFSMIKARDAAGSWLEVGYQWSFSEAIRKLKADLVKGVFGKPLRFSCIVLAPRTEAYYGRNNWAGRIKDDAGRWVLDSPVNNATAHYLHNLFFLLGPRQDAGAIPVEISAELYRANSIENYDTAALRVKTDAGTELLFYASHAVAKGCAPVFRLECEDARIVYEKDEFVASFRNGKTVSYGFPNAQGNMTKLDRVLERCVDKSLSPICPIETAMSHTIAVNGAQESSAEIVDFPPSLVREEGEPGSRLRRVEGLEETLVHCFEKEKLPSEAGISWAVAGRRVDLAGYRFFPSF